LAINPTSGVDLDNAGEFLRNGAASVGLVAPLFDPAAIARGDFDQIGTCEEFESSFVMLLYHHCYTDNFFLQPRMRPKLWPM
jgi:hypothetical protein